MSIPPPIDGLAKDERLGEPVSVHDPRTENPRARTWLVVLGLPGLVLLPFTVRFLIHGFGWATVLSVLLTIGYLGAAGRILLRDVLPGYGKVVYLYGNGLILADRGDMKVFAWDAIKEMRVSGVRIGSSETVSWRCVLVRADSTEAVVGPEFPGVQDVVEAVSSAVTERLLPKYISRVETGGSVRFGPFTISREGITKDDEQVPWPQVASVEISNGMVYMNRRDRTAGMTATAGEVPNAVAFSELARHVQRVQTE
ncbi:hypothetical protein GCM10027176_28760 [Actinoallomurus bryophytorum]|uniref:Uncharacterized protein n=1 Tax=Actinoallomurus bryophytorum TaxID=1490222 RepID=A0A543CGX5_9ACTN|nr:DUF6585 family protein [Actinoallomurus bryophytorum]TQL96260.1 hypothetical protein FB559_1786 [Actinoallomurus bryophytorum]